MSAADDADDAKADADADAADRAPLFHVRDTPSAGRALFAARDAAPDTPLLRADDLTASVIFREYRKEVCGQCLAYDRGVEWKIRDPTGFVFCRPACQAAWHESTRGPAKLAYQALHAFVTRSYRNQDDADTHDVAPRTRPDAAEIDRAWHETTCKLAAIMAARVRPQHTKADARCLRLALATPPVPDTINFLLSGVLCHAGLQGSWDEVMKLHSCAEPYVSAQDLQQHLDAQRHLVALLPMPLHEAANPTVLHTVVARAAQNSFGIRSTDDGGSEFLGYGIWPSASYFNHSCRPNVRKTRVGRAWHFSTSEHVKDGDELCISYLGGDEDDLDSLQRRQRLSSSWGFYCTCVKCSTPDT